MNLLRVRANKHLNTRRHSTKNSLIQTVSTVALLLGVSSGLLAADSNEIEALLKGYEGVLNASDVDGVLELCTEDGVFTAPNNPSVVGIEQVEAAYTAVFQAIDLKVEFDIVEIEAISDDWAFARTNSTGMTTIKATGDKVAEGNQELFVPRKVDGDWKIARYGFLRPTHHANPSALPHDGWRVAAPPDKRWPAG